MNNVFVDVGDIRLFKLDHPTSGIQSITGYVESVVGEDSTHTLRREFRYTLDGINWTDFEPLTQQSIQNIPIQPQFDFDIEFRYTREGVSGGTIVWNYTTIEYTAIDRDCGDNFNSSVFVSVFSCCQPDVLDWCLNVTNKLYQPGIVMKAMTRNTNHNENDEDRDYIDFWRSIACYYAMFVMYARYFENTRNDHSLIKKYLQVRDIYVGDSNLSTLQNIAKHRYQHYRYRGTRLFVGELSRMIMRRDSDEFLVAINKGHNVGWWLNHHSPLYKGIENNRDYIKLFQLNPDVSDDENYPIDTTNNYIVWNSNVMDSELHIEKPNGVVSEGISKNAPTADKFWTNVNSLQNYQLHFQVKVFDSDARLTVKMWSKDVLGNDTNPISIQGQQSNVAIDRMRFAKTSEWYDVRVILWGANTPIQTQPSVAIPSIAYGTNLKQHIEASKVFVEILSEANNNNEVKMFVRNVEFKPLKTPYSKATNNPFVEMWLNNYAALNEQQLTEIINNTLLPYKMTTKLNLL